jgi:hypothetical protein
MYFLLRLSQAFQIALDERLLSCLKNTSKNNGTQSSNRNKAMKREEANILREIQRQKAIFFITVPACFFL